MGKRISALSAAQRRILQSMIDWGSEEKPMRLELTRGHWLYDTGDERIGLTKVNDNTGNALRRKGFINRCGGNFTSDLFTISLSGLAAVLSIHSGDLKRKQ